MQATDSTLTPRHSIDGIWVNNNIHERNTTKIIISNSGRHVQVLGKHKSKDYDWGINMLTPEAYNMNMYWAIFDNNKAKSTFLFTINNDDMEVRYEHHYKSSEAETKSFVASFKRLSLHCETATLSKPTNGVVHSEMVLEGMPITEQHKDTVLLIKDKEQKAFKWMRYVSVFLNKARHTISLRKLLSITHIMTWPRNVL